MGVPASELIHKLEIDVKAVATRSNNNGVDVGRVDSSWVGEIAEQRECAGGRDQAGDIEMRRRLPLQAGQTGRT
jgi:hypothetical protein